MRTDRLVMDILDAALAEGQTINVQISKNAVRVYSEDEQNVIIVGHSGRCATTDKQTCLEAVEAIPETVAEVAWGMTIND